MKKYQLENPSDARIFMDIKNRKVNFEYPSKQSAFQVVFSQFIAIWFKILILFVIPNALIIMVWVMGKSINQGAKSSGYYIIPIILIILSTILIILIAPPFFASAIFVSNKKLLKKMPIINMKLGQLAGIIHNTTTIKKLKEKVYEIPLFENVFLTYKAKKDFAKYLEKIEITEHKFNYIIYSSFYTFFRKKEKKAQTDYWKAKFIFSKIPDSGYLKLDWL